MVCHDVLKPLPNSSRHRSHSPYNNHPTRIHPPQEHAMPAASATATTKKMFIDGQWAAAQDGKTVGIINPATEEVIVDMAFGSRADTRRAIAAARKAMPSWMKLTPYDRAKVLKKTADLMRERA